MNLKRDIAPITRLKNNTAAVAREVSETGRPLVITQNGKAKLVVMSVEDFDRRENVLALLKIIALGEADAAAGRAIPQEKVFREIDELLAKKADD